MKKEIEREPLIFERGRSGRTAYSLPELDVPEQPVDNLIPDAARRQTSPSLPEVSEPELVRHYVRLSQLNHAIDTGFYPLGSCTMKYNPKINEVIARLPGFAALHPYADESQSQGALQLMYELEQYLCEIGGMDRVTLQPAAGAQGELTGLLLMRAYHTYHQHEHKRKIVIPDSAHGTNPATARMCGYEVLEVSSDGRGGIDLDDLKARVDETVAGLMLTNPNTLGVFDENIQEIADLIHSAGGLLYYDGANANAILGYSRARDMGFDVVHFNLHKTFATPHGGGGPGAGPVGVTGELEPFLPVPLVAYDEQTGQYYWETERPHSIGRMRSFYGNFGVLVRAYTYLRSQGAAGLKHISENAVLNANYLLHRLRQAYEVPYDRICKHEFVLSGRRQKEEHGVATHDIAKRLLDYGMHAPTVYFPLIVEEALMVEPTETESKETLDAFADAMLSIAREIENDPDRVRGAPYHTVVGRLDEARAARQPDLAYMEDVASPAGDHQ